MSFTVIGNVLNSKIGAGTLGKSVTAALVCEEFERLIYARWGEKIKSLAKPMYLKDKILTVACLSPVVASELKLNEAELIDGLNQKFGEGTVENIRLLM